ncbi:tRNA (guanine(46)-N(7))-methyltransferase TrmB [Lacunimicrobium album]
MAQLAPPVDLRPYFISLDELPLPLDPQELFVARQPLEIDVGCGRGLFVHNASTSTPEVNFLGLELDFKEGRRGAMRLKKKEQPNARVIGGDAKKALSQYFPEACAEKVHVYFPDPWWKNKHHKRRLFTADFVEMVLKMLVDGGELHLWTDVTDYWEMVRETMQPVTLFEELEPPAEREPEHDLDYQTSFERKKRQSGWPIYRGRWKRAAR